MSTLAPLPNGHVYWVAGQGPVRIAHDWTAWLAANGGGTITASAWVSMDDEVDVDAAGTPNDPEDGWTSVAVSGGTAGNRARLREQITTSDDQHPIRTIHLHVVADIPA
jgi:hypothetical protein